MSLEPGLQLFALMNETDVVAVKTYLPMCAATDCLGLLVCASGSGGLALNLAGIRGGGHRARYVVVGDQVHDIVHPCVNVGLDVWKNGRRKC